MKGPLFAGILATLVIAANAAAVTPTTNWQRKDIYAAVKAIGYPAAHMKKLGCHGIGTADSTGGHTAYSCTSTYTHHRHRRFIIGGLGEGGWLCAAKTLASCKLLRKGFITSGQIRVQGRAASVDLAARGYVNNKYGGYTLAHFCQQADASTYTCAFTVSSGEDINVTITLKQAKGGYVETATG